MDSRAPVQRVANEAEEPRLRRFLVSVQALAAFFTLFEAVGALRYRIPGFVAGAVDLALVVVAMHVARRMARAGQTARAATFAAYALLAAICGLTVFETFAWPVFLFGSIMPVISLLPHVRGAPFRRFFYATFVATVFIGFIGMYGDHSVNVPAWFVGTLMVSGLAGSSFLVLFNLWRFAARLRDTMDRIVSSNVAIESAREVAERSRARLEFLATASTRLASSLEYGATLDAIAALVVPALADACAIDLVGDDGRVRRLVRIGASAEGEATTRPPRSIPPEANDEAVRVIAASSRAELIEHVTDESLAQLPNAHYRDAIRTLGLNAAIVVPLAAHGDPLGTLVFGSTTSNRTYDTSDVAMARELAHRAAAAIENARLYQTAQAASHEKDAFLSTISHELRTPLTAILGWLHILQSGRQEVAPRAIETIARNARTQARLVEDLLDVSRIISGKLVIDRRTVDLRGVLRAAVDAVAPSAEQKGLTLDVTLDERDAFVSADPVRLEQVVWNLLANAIKFTPTGGHVTVQSECGSGTATITVTDDGEGIRAEDLPHIFDRFRQADSTTTRKHGGLGLGLAIVRHLVELHGGQVRAASDGTDKGATFTVSLPIAEKPAVATSVVRSAPWPTVNGRANPGERQLESVRVLVVEDDADSRAMLSTVLESAGATVTTAENMRTALDAVARATHDVLVSDIAMPGGDGYELIETLRRGGGTIPALALTAHAREEDRRRAVASGYQVHMSKPIEPQALVGAVAALARGGGRLHASA